MTKEEQRAAIAELMGFEWYRIPNKPNDSHIYRYLAHPSVQEHEADRWKQRADGTERIANWEFIEKEGFVSNYLLDRNAMVEVMETLVSPKPEFRVQWVNWMRAILPKPVSDYDIAMAPLEAWSEALLRIFGRWKEDEAPVATTPPLP